MMRFEKNKIELENKGYSVLNQLYTVSEIQEILQIIKNSEKSGNSFLKTKDLFAIRQLLNVIPDLKQVLFNSKLIDLVNGLFDTECFLTKAIYFDKPKESNWFVSYHQDLSISVNRKVEVENYINWTYKKNQFGVQPPTEVLDNIITIRIHLDTTNADNGALRVIPKSHQKGICRVDSIDWENKEEQICQVNKGGVMLMKPLTLHASNRTTNQKQRRVIHLEFCNKELAEPIEWLERIKLRDYTG
ncbi:phytanoyl-CoA dioxygenase family protein [Aquimarina sp. 2201CG5-10]|uniref:phytanoyl-CoA dioxygenase family protein n=1 Tax=Aquimarina callyspongiae TaxID=3098150 RepID=UPI002AB42BDA|nr:phytanoyl-CoA dioxygenase family protein [Aquimarina sp. 2201CG5-10]MDY8138731.1 phytanoyl-CoA dioxygenase family protein [Aquimarina sp. 2201CG5-10]